MQRHFLTSLGSSQLKTFQLQFFSTAFSNYGGILFLIRLEEVSHVFRAAFFLISNLSKFIIFIVIFSHHVVQITFFFLISICFDISFFSNSDESNFDDGPNSRIADRLCPNHGPDQTKLGPKSQTAVQIRTGTVIWSGSIFHGTYLVKKVRENFRKCFFQGVNDKFKIGRA